MKVPSQKPSARSGGASDSKGKKLMDVVSRGDTKGLQTLVSSKDFNPNHVGTDGDTALHKCVKCSKESKAKDKYIKCAQMLVKSGADMTEEDSDGRTPFHCSVMDNNVAMVEELLKLGADAKISDKDGYTALDLAIKHKKHSALKALIKDKEVSESLNDA